MRVGKRHAHKRFESVLFSLKRTGVDVFQDVDIHDWEFGGRR